MNQQGRDVWDLRDLSGTVIKSGSVSVIHRASSASQRVLCFNIIVEMLHGETFGAELLDVTPKA